MCELCTSRRSREKYAERNGRLPRFSITPLANTVTTPCGRTTTWQHFAETIATLTPSPTHGAMAITQSHRSQLVEQSIWLDTQSKSSRRLRMSDSTEIKNRSFASHPEIPQLAQLVSITCWPSIVDHLVRESSSQQEMSDALSALAVRCIHYRDTFLTSCEDRSVSLSATKSG